MLLPQKKERYLGRNSIEVFDSRQTGIIMLTQIATTGWKSNGNRDFC